MASYLDDQKFDLLPKEARCSVHPPKILISYGSLRPKSYPRYLAREAERILKHMGAETHFYDPTGLPMFDQVSGVVPRLVEKKGCVVHSFGCVG